MSIEKKTVMVTLGNLGELLRDMLIQVPASMTDDEIVEAIEAADCDVRDDAWTDRHQLNQYDFFDWKWYINGNYDPEDEEYLASMRLVQTDQGYTVEDIPEELQRREEM